MKKHSLECRIRVVSSDYKYVNFRKYITMPFIPQSGMYIEKIHHDPVRVDFASYDYKSENTTVVFEPIQMEYTEEKEKIVEVMNQNGWRECK